MTTLVWIMIVFGCGTLPFLVQGCSVLKILRLSLRGSEADEAISSLQHGDCFGKIRLVMTYKRRTEQPWFLVWVEPLIPVGACQW